MKNLFGTSGIRGVFGTELTEKLSFEVAKAFGQYLGQGKRVVVGRDNRPGADEISHAAVHGLSAVGMKVVDLGILPTPELSFHLVRMKADGGMMITGSHLPIKCLGIIPLLKDGSGVYGQSGEAITKIYEKNSSNLS
ncbi:MAG: hypothetical protein U0946_06245 [Patescibacteria group bacterium]|nr:hypothetical protein [Patescibacteria group bacterium]